VVQIPFYLPTRGNTTLVITDLLGRKVFEKTSSLEKGAHQWIWEPDTMVSEGIYFSVLTFEHQKISKRIFYFR
jgi:hypothetical protein